MSQVNEPHIIIDEARYITVPSALKRIAVQYDHDVETVTFDCPRYWDGLDMSTMLIFINYMTPDGSFGSYIADNVYVDPNNPKLMHFSWTISQNVTRFNGVISFLICIKRCDIDGYEINHWSSELNREMHVSEGMECVETIISQYPDILAQLLERMAAVDERTSVEAMKGYVEEYVDEHYTEMLIERIDNKLESEMTKEYLDGYLDEHPLLIDATLTEENRAADAKATGEAIENVRQELAETVDNMTEVISNAKSEIEQMGEDIRDVVDAKINNLNTLNFMEFDPSGWINSSSEPDKMHEVSYYGFANGKFYLVGSYSVDKSEYDEDGEVITEDYDYYVECCYSTDGINWTRVENGPFDEDSVSNMDDLLMETVGIDTVAARDSFYDNMAYGNGVYVRATSSGGKAKFYYSADGLTWNDAVGTGDYIPTMVEYGNGVFVASSSTGDIWCSSTGTTWNTRGRIGAGVDCRLLYDPTYERFLLIGGQTHYYSNDGLVWHDYTDSIPLSSIKSAAVYNGVYVAICGTRVYKSADGLQWFDLEIKSGITNPSLLTFGNPPDLLCGNDKILAVQPHYSGADTYCISLISHTESIESLLRKLYAASDISSLL